MCIGHHVINGIYVSTRVHRVYMCITDMNDVHIHVHVINKDK